MIRIIYISYDEFCSYLHPTLTGSGKLLIKWNLSPPGFVKLNVDGSFLERSLVTGSGGILRSETGEWITGFSSCEGAGNPLLAELLAIKHGLNLAWEGGFRNIICETDSQEAVQLIHATSPHALHVFADTMEQILDLMQRSWLVEMHHVFREANACADFLARYNTSNCTGWKL